MSDSPNFGQQLRVKPIKTRDDYIREWDGYSNQLGQLKELEKIARDNAVSATFGSNFNEGTNTVELGNGYKLKCQYKYTRKFIVPEGLDLNAEGPTSVSEAVEHLTTILRQHSNEAAFIASRLIKWEPKISDKEYKEIPESIRKIVDKYVESKTSVVSVELVKPKTAGA